MKHRSRRPYDRPLCYLYDGFLLKKKVFTFAVLVSVGVGERRPGPSRRDDLTRNVDNMFQSTGSVLRVVPHTDSKEVRLVKALVLQNENSLCLYESFTPFLAYLLVCDRDLRRQVIPLCVVGGDLQVTGLFRTPT